MSSQGMMQSKQLGESWLADEVAALTRLNQATARMWCVGSVEEGLEEILSAAIDLMGAHKGYIQLFDETRQVLSNAAQIGFDRSFLETVREVSAKGDTTCARALRTRKRVVVEDVEADDWCVELCGAAREADFRALQSTPIFDRNGKLLGMISTHFGWPQKFREADLERLDLYASQAAEFIQHCRMNHLLRENEKRLQLFVDSAPTAMAMFDRELRYLAASRRWMNEYQLDAGLVGRSLFDVFPNARSTLKSLQRCCLSEEVVSFQISGLSQSHDSKRIVKWDSGPWFMTNGEIGGITIVEEEITAYKEAERSLKWRVECDCLASDAAARLLESSDPRALVEELCRNIMNLFGFHLFLTFLADAQTGRLRLDSYAGITEEEARKVEWLNYAHTLCGNVVRDRRVIVGGEILKSADPKMNLLEVWGIQAYCCHPLVVQGKVIGTMSFGARDRDHFTLDEVNVIRSVTDMMAIAMNRVQTEKNLRHSERQLQVFVENAPAAIAMFDQRMRYLAASRRWIDDNNLPDQIIGRCHYDLAPELTERWKEIHRRGLAGETLSSAGDSYVHPDGRLQWVKWEVLPWYNSEGNLGGILVTTEDITELKQVERSLKILNESLEKQVVERTREVRNREERLRAILNAAVDAIITFDVEGTIQSINPATERLFECRSAQLIGERVQTLIVDPVHSEWIRQHATTVHFDYGNIISSGRELVARRNDGTTFFAELSVSEIPELGVLIGIFRDVSQRKELEREVVEAASLEQRRIGADLHDSVGQELTALNLLAQTLKEDPISGGPLIERIVDGLRRCKDQMRLVLRGLVPVPIDSMGLMSALSDLAEVAEKDAKLNCSFDCPQPVAVADNLAATHLYLIAQEAVHNAVKHARAKNIRISLESNAHLTLRIEDDGCGISDPKSDSSPFGGLGLRIMRNRAAIIGAGLSVERNSPSGTVVECTLSRMNKG